MISLQKKKETVNSILKTLSLEDEIVPKSSTTVFRMVGELGFLSDMKTFHAVGSAENCTLVYDSTTQDGQHVNCVLTTPTSSHLVSLERLPGGGVCHGLQAAYYRPINRLAKVGLISTGASVDASLKKIISKIKCCLTNRSPVNHSRVSLLEKEWQVNFLELYCNLHPLKPVTRKTRKALWYCEACTSSVVSGCLAWGIIVGLNSLRFSEKLGNINDMKTFIKQQGLSLSQITRFRGNHLLIIFHLGARCKQFVPGLPSTNLYLQVAATFHRRSRYCRVASAWNHREAASRALDEYLLFIS